MLIRALRIWLFGRSHRATGARSMFFLSVYLPIGWLRALPSIRPWRLSDEPIAALRTSPMLATRLDDDEWEQKLGPREQRLAGALLHSLTGSSDEAFRTRRDDGYSR
jgi:hypothetical protein